MINAEIVYATITGNNEDIADIITEELENKGVNVRKDEISQADVSDFKNVDICIVCTYTYNEGNVPEEAKDFFEDLKKTNLNKKIYGVAGSGDKFYAQYYCTALDKFEEAFNQTGAIKGAMTTKINLSPSEKDIDILNKFSDQLLLTLKELNK